MYNTQSGNIPIFEIIKYLKNEDLEMTKKMGIFSLVLMVALLLGCGNKPPTPAEEQARIEKLAGEIGQLTRGDLVVLKNEKLLYIGAAPEKVSGPIVLIPWIGSGRNESLGDPALLASQTLTIVKKTHPDYNQVLLCFARQNPWR